MPPDNAWNEWSKFVLKELDRLSTCYESLDEKMGQIRTEIAMLKVKSGIWGLIGAAIPVAIGIGIWLVK